MFRATLLFLSLPFASVLSAQTRIEAGVALGEQPYLSSGESPRGLPSADLLVRGNAAGVHAAVEYTDLPELGALVAAHIDAVYRHGERFFFLAGAGPTVLFTGSSDMTWNAELELGRAWRTTELFVRARHYDFSYTRFRDRPASPTGPALYLGIRFNLRH